MPHVEQELSTLPKHLSSHRLLNCLGEVCVIYVIKLHIFTFLVACYNVHYDLFPRKMMFVLTPICVVEGLCFIYAICIY